MDTEAFLQRVVAQSQHVAVVYNTTPGAKGGYRLRAFQGGRVADAAGFARWADSKGFDVYFALGSLIHVEPNKVDVRGNITYRGERVRENIGFLKSFWIDIDCARPSDKPGVQKTYKTQADALVWLKGFLAATKLPRPNQVVNSGYGLHVYWVLEDAMALGAWQPYADALKAALIAHNFIGDVGISSDASRILRLPNTLNHKLAPARPVAVLDKLTYGELPNSLVLAALQPFVGVAVLPKMATTVVGGAAAVGGSSAAALVGGGAQVVSMFAGGPNMNAAAVAGTPHMAAPRSFAHIATQCAQVGLSLSTGGATDIYPLWYLGMLSLAHHCADGADFVHPVSSAHPGYTPADTDLAVQRISVEHQRKGHGPPTCAFFAQHRPATCQGCPHAGQIASPWALGVVPDTSMPEGFRRHGGYIQAEFLNPKTGNTSWQDLVAGDISHPLLDRLPQGGFALSFVYTRTGENYPIYCLVGDLSTDVNTIFKLFQQQELVLLPGREAKWRQFMLSWVEKLRDHQEQRAGVSNAFGWIKRNGKIAGFAVGDALYRSDGTVEPLNGTDPFILGFYRPSGDLAAWKAAATFIAPHRVELQPIIAASFAAPLMALAGYSGVALSAWSSQSGIGKSAAMDLAQSVWASRAAMHNLDDTTNAIARKLGETRSMPAMWDEVRFENDRAMGFVNFLFGLTQGREKARLTRDSTIRQPGSWDTMICMTSNRALMDHVLEHTQSTEAGAVRLLEWRVDPVKQAQNPAAQQIVASVRDHYGHAGRIYAAYIARHHAGISKALAKHASQIAIDVQATDEERLFVAAAASLVVGAGLAMLLGLVPFDVKAIRAQMLDVIRQQRAQRRATLTSANGILDLDEIFGRFMTQMVPHKLVTTVAALPGQKGGVEVLWTPQKGVAHVHVIQNPGIIRIGRRALVQWCRDERIPESIFIDGLLGLWGGTAKRLVIGGGTNYSAQIACIELPATAPNLAAYLNARPGPSTAPHTVVPAAAPARAQAPNAPRV